METKNGKHQSNRFLILENQLNLQKSILNKLVYLRKIKLIMKLTRIS